RHDLRPHPVRQLPQARLRLHPPPPAQDLLPPRLPHDRRLLLQGGPAPVGPRGRRRARGRQEPQPQGPRRHPLVHPRARLLPRPPRPRPEGRPRRRVRMKKLIHRRLIVPAALLAVGAGVYFVPGLINGPEPEEVALSTIAEHIEAGDVTAATLSEVDRSVTVTLTDGVELTSNYVGAYGETLTEDLLAAGVDAEVDAPPGKSWLDYLGTFVTLLLFAPLIFLILSQIGGLKRSRPEVVEVPTTRFSDVAGMDEAVEEMKELVEFLRDGKRFAAVGARPPKGALLYGPPGTGKTLLARAVAGEAGVPFFQATGSDFDEIFVGVGASRIRSLFKRAKEAGRAIIF